MAGSIAAHHGRRSKPRVRVSGKTGAALGLLLAALAFLGLFVAAPLVTVFTSAFARGIGPFWASLGDPETQAAIRLTLLTAGIVVPVNVLFGLAAAWLIAKYEFWGKSALITLIDLPFSVSPVIAGLIFVLLFGAQGVFAPYLREYDIKILFAVPGIVMATTFVTFPLVAREVLAVMQAQGSDEEEAALTLGASGLQVLWHVTLPKIRWGLFYGVVLCNARAMGEFGAVSVVSGHIRGETNTMPLEVEILYNEYNFVGAFAVASLLAGLALVTLAAKHGIEFLSAIQARRAARRLRSPNRAVAREVRSDAPHLPAKGLLNLPEES